MSDTTEQSNHLLRVLPDAAWHELRRVARPVAVRHGDVLMDEQRIAAVHFPLGAVVSLVTVLSDGAQVEAATIGREGMVGLPLFLGAGRSSLRAVVRVPGAVLRVSTDDFRPLLVDVDGPMSVVMQRYAQTLMTQLGQNAACGQAHTLRQRCARWLLVADDTTGGEPFSLTHEALAAALGVRRAGVSEVAAELAAQGCLRYRRGVVQVLDREGLRGVACECYGVVAEAVERMVRGGSRSVDGSDEVPSLE